MRACGRQVLLELCRPGDVRRIWASGANQQGVAHISVSDWDKVAGDGSWDPESMAGAVGSWTWRL